MIISTTHPAFRARQALIQREHDEEIRADERRVIVNDVMNFIHDNEDSFSECSAKVLLLIIHQIEKKG